MWGRPAPLHSNGNIRWQTWLMAAGLLLAILGPFAAEEQSKVSTLQHDVEEMKVAQAKTEDQFIEVDTQLRATIDEDNKTLAWQMRMNAIMWEKLNNGKSHLPTDNAFYPNIANGESR